MKTIEQLLQLSKNKYYKFTPEERMVLDDFLLKKQAKDSKDSASKSLTKLSDKTRVRVKNIVEKAPTEPVDVNNSAS